MKRIIAALLALAMLGLFACGEAESEPTTTVPTTEEIETTTEAETTTETTTEAPTTAPFIFSPMSGESNGVKWRTLDLEDEENREIKEWLDDWIAERKRSQVEDRPMEYHMGDKKTITYKNDWPKRQLVMRENATGKETVLLEGNGIDGEEARNPYLIEVLDERYFIYAWGGWEWLWSTGVCDTVEHREIRIDEGDMWRQYYARRDNSIYLINYEDDAPLWGPLFLYKADLSQLPGPIKSVDVLRNIPAAKEIGMVRDTLLTDDERLFIALEEEADYRILDEKAGLYIFDLKNEKLLFHLPKASLGVEMREGWTHAYFGHFALRGKTIYWFTDNTNFPSPIVELILP